MSSMPSSYRRLAAALAAIALLVGGLILALNGTPQEPASESDTHKARGLNSWPKANTGPVVRYRAPESRAGKAACRAASQTIRNLAEAGDYKNLDATGRSTLQRAEEEARQTCSVEQRRKIEDTLLQPLYGVEK